MKRVEIFYHLYIPADERYQMWTWWVDEQMQLLHELHRIAKVNMCITMPINFMTKVPPIRFGDDVVQYVQSRYPFVNIIDIRDTGEFNLYEGQTLGHLYNSCLEEDIYVLYFHSKGITSNTTNVNCWRQILNHYLIKDWPECLFELTREDVDVVGIKDASCHEYAISGNFWWSKSSYIRTLPEPIDSTKYKDNPTFYPGGPDYRYCFEDWLWSGKPRIHTVLDTKVKHFDQAVYLEDYLGRDPSGVC